MHPDIEKFWKDQGYSIVIDVLEGGVSGNDLWRFNWAAFKGSEKDWKYKYVGWSDPLAPGDEEALCTIYSIDGKKYSEREMLKIIKLKAFI